MPDTFVAYMTKDLNPTLNIRLNSIKAFKYTKFYRIGS